MNSPIPDPLRPMAVYRRLLGYSLPHWKVMVLAFLATFLFASVDAAFVKLIQTLVDRVFIDRDSFFIRIIPLVIIVLFVLRGAAAFTSAYGMAWVARRMIFTVRGELFDKLLRLPLRFYDRMPSGALVARLTYFVEQVADAVTKVLGTLFKEVLSILLYIGLMFYFNWRLALFIFVVAPPIALIIRYVNRRFRQISTRIQNSVAGVTIAAQEAVEAQRLVKISNGQAQERGRFGKVNELNRWLSLKIVATQAGSSAVIQFIAAGAVAAVIYFATQPAMLDRMTPGDFAGFLFAMASLLQPIRSLGSVNERLQRGIAAGTEIFRMLAEVQEPAGGTRPLQRAQGRIGFHGVRFRYDDDAQEALRGIDLEIEPGQTVALVGRSGSGKSTLLSLLPRFYDPTAGEVRLDGHDLREYPLDRLRAQFALVDQQVRLFNSSVAENIAYGLQPAPPEARIIEAAKAAYAWEFIEKLPEGLNTVTGQNGVMLSGGQRQRLAIARALLRDAPILLLDEATSALDTESERYIQKALETLVRGRTTLVIAHRLSTVQRADRIVVLQEGQIVEAGQHADLLGKNGLYAALYQMQFEAA
jgi:ATP-binding cassette, subfamily B, bacterial MsbA